MPCIISSFLHSLNILAPPFQIYPVAALKLVHQEVYVLPLELEGVSDKYRLRASSPPCDRLQEIGCPIILARSVHLLGLSNTVHISTTSQRIYIYFLGGGGVTSKAVNIHLDEFR